MNQQLAKIIKEDLIKNMKCGSCGSFYESSDISIKSLGGNKSFIIADCKKCDTETQFEADIMEQEDAEKMLGQKLNGKGMQKVNVSNEKHDFNKKVSFGGSVIQNEEIEYIHNKMKNFSSFKNLFSLILVFSVFFTGCADTAEENRQNILNSINSVKTQIEETKNQAEEIYKEGKVKFDQAKELIESAPEKIEKAKSDIEKIANDAIKLKEDLEKKIESTKKAIDETKKAVDAVSNAMDSISAITGTGEVK